MVYNGKIKLNLLIGLVLVAQKQQLISLLAGNNYSKLIYKLKREGQKSILRYVNMIVLHVIT
jgi:hypothetical protein